MCAQPHLYRMSTQRGGEGWGGGALMLSAARGPLLQSGSVSRPKSEPDKKHMAWVKNTRPRVEAALVHATIARDTACAQGHRGNEFCRTPASHSGLRAHPHLLTRQVQVRSPLSSRCQWPPTWFPSGYHEANVVREPLVLKWALRRGR